MTLHTSRKRTLLESSLEHCYYLERFVQSAVVRTIEPSSDAVLRYIELKTGYADNGPAWIARVKLSKSGRTIYFNGKALKRAARGVSGNHYDVQTGQEYWVSGVKKRGLDRHWAGSGIVSIEAAAVSEYLQLTGAEELDGSRFQVIADLEEPDPSQFTALENEALQPRAERGTTR